MAWVTCSSSAQASFEIMLGGWRGLNTWLSGITLFFPGQREEQKSESEKEMATTV